MTAVFVYGTLLRGERLSHIIEASGPIRVLPACTSGRLVNLGDCPGMIPARRSGQWVLGEYAEFETLGSVLPQLDFIEEYQPDAEARSLYLRRSVPVVLEDGSERWAWAYIYNRPYDPRRIIKNGDWRKRTAEG